MSLTNRGYTLAGGADPVKLGSSDKYNKYFLIQNKDGANDALYGFSFDDAQAGQAFILAPGDVAAINWLEPGGGNVEVWARSATANPVNVTFGTNGSFD